MTTVLSKISRLIIKHNYTRYPSRLASFPFSQTKWVNTKRTIEHVPSIKDFMSEQNTNNEYDLSEDVTPPYLNPKTSQVTNKSVYFETYGCQMNVSDTELAWAILKKDGYTQANNASEVGKYITLYPHDIT